MRIRVMETTRIKVKGGKHADLDAHHEYYLDDETAAHLVAKGKAVELDLRGRPVEPKPATKDEPAEKPKKDAPPEVKPTGTEGKPGATRSGKAVAPPENKTGDTTTATGAAATETDKGKADKGKGKGDG